MNSQFAPAHGQTNRRLISRVTTGGRHESLCDGPRPRCEQLFKMESPSVDDGGAAANLCIPAGSTLLSPGVARRLSSPLLWSRKAMQRCWVRRHRGFHGKQEGMARNDPAMLPPLPMPAVHPLLRVQAVPESAAAEIPSSFQVGNVVPHSSESSVLTTMAQATPTTSSTRKNTGRTGTAQTSGRAP